MFKLRLGCRIQLCCFLTVGLPTLLGAKQSLASDNAAIPIQLEEVVVYSLRRDITAHTAPYTSNRLTQADFANSLARNLPEALSALPGVMIQKTSNGQGSPFLRGFTGYRTLTLIDGVRYNNSVYRDGPNEYFSLIDFSSLADVELLSGPASTLYGSDAIGGTLSLRSAYPEFENRKLGEYYQNTSIQYRTASAEQSHQVRAQMDIGQGQNWGLKIGLSDKHFGDVKAAKLGEQKHTGYDENSWDLRFDMRLNDQWQLSVLRQELKQDDVWRTHSTQYAVTFSGSSIGTDQRRLKDQQRQLTYIKLHGSQLDSIINHAQITLSQQRWQEDGERIRFSDKQQFESFDSTMWGLDLQLQTFTNSADFTYGVDYYVDFVDSARTDIDSNGVTVQRIQGPIGDDSRFSQLGLYLQSVFQVSNNTSLHVGNRYTNVDANVGRFEDRVSNLAVSYSQKFDNISHSLRVQHALDSNQNWQLWAGLSQSFRAPNIADLSRFGGSRSNEIEVAATNLKPEKFVTSEIGFKVKSEDMRFNASVYQTNIKDFISSSATGRIIDGQIEVSKQNANNGTVRGIELQLEYQLPSDLNIQASLTWLKGDLQRVDTSSNAQFNDPMSRIMPLTAHIRLRQTLLQQQYWWAVSITASDKATRLSQGDIGDTQRIPPGGTPAYTLVDLSAGGQLNNNINATLSLSNALDEAYRTHGSGSNEPGLGIKFSITMALGSS